LNHRQEATWVFKEAQGARCASIPFVGELIEARPSHADVGDLNGDEETVEENQ
jgi:hypothetical protein